ncbi:E3 ubiquitin-protein ligase AIRP2-like isoform X1 [Malania oleifera]|uniref:E3 ubiquitin-protein ligase AIRP2-like isoform X1 n=1 Tax=Malania oleifera TaxID=397392 RepID=UPI0025AE761A|nr:E3 ubiquitin-protein ligase AIRP2-like isoform X1 [Malania oleifera]
MWQKHPNASSYRESIKSLEADIQHANTLAAALPRYCNGDCIQMRLAYGPFAPFFLFLIEWLNFNCTDTLPSYLGLLHILVYKVYVDGMPTMSSQERKATLREFYAVIYPMLRQLEGELIELEDYNKRSRCSDVVNRKRLEERRKLCDKDQDRDDECGICMETCSKMVLPSCGHSMCISCFHDWYKIISLTLHDYFIVFQKGDVIKMYSMLIIRNVRSRSCPFCRGSLKRVSSRDLWVLTSNGDVIDTITLAKENVRCFYLYIENLPLMVPNTTQVSVFDYMI